MPGEIHPYFVVGEDRAAFRALVERACHLQGFDIRVDRLDVAPDAMRLKRIGPGD
jgi:hypothetical protein